MARKLVSEGTSHLFHYTSVDAFISIFQTKKFWATYFSDMNDISEQQRFGSRGIEFIQPILVNIFSERATREGAFARRLAEGGGPGSVSRREAELHISQFHESIFRDLEGPFITSFCTHDAASYEARHGLLSQWRGYGANGGVAIVISTAGIESLMRRERDDFAHALNHLGDVRYDHDDAGIRDDFSDFFEQVPAILKDFYAAVPPSYERIFDAFVRGTTLVKHQAFHEEREIRIVVCPRATKLSSTFYDDHHDGKPVKVIKYRRRLDGEARYIELFGAEALPIKRVIIGPSRIQNVNRQRVAEVLEGTEISLDVSNIPFVA